MELRSYPKSLNAGHRGVADLLLGPVSVQEKVDGSQFSFGIFDGVLLMRSRNKMIEDGAPGMFREACDSVFQRRDLLVPGFTYRAEYLQKPKHNTLTYSRVPEGNLILFDIDTGYEDYMTYAGMAEQAADLNLEVVPEFTSGVVSLTDVRQFLERESVLGGTLIEGLVFKPVQYVIGPDGMRMQMKYVSERFKEKHTKDWKERNPGGKDIMQQIANTLKLQGWWEIAVAQAKAEGVLENAPQDIGPLLQRVNHLVAEAEEDSYFIHDALYDWARKDIMRGLTRGFAEWYKDMLLTEAFDG